MVGSLSDRYIKIEELGILNRSMAMFVIKTEFRISKL